MGIYEATSRVEEERQASGDPTLDPRLDLHPADEHNRKLVAHVHPTEWRNPRPDGRYNMVILGVGTIEVAGTRLDFAQGVIATGARLRCAAPSARQRRTGELKPEM